MSFRDGSVDARVMSVVVRRGWRARVAAGVVLGVLAGVLVGLPVRSAAAAVGLAPLAGRDRSVSVGVVKSRAARVSQSDRQVWSAPGPPSWPAAGSVVVDVPAGGAAARVGSLPVRVAGVGAGGPGRVRVEVADRARARAAGVDGVLLRLTRADGVGWSGELDLGVEYSGFAGAFGGDWARRLGLLALPACGWDNPGGTGCGVRQPVASVNDANASVVSAVVAVGASEVSARGRVERKLAGDSLVGTDPGGSVVVALSAGASSDAGDFSKTPFGLSYTWAAGGSAGDFSWSYPVGVASVPGELKPQVVLGYSSGSVDGRTAGKNVQPSWLGEGWEFQPGFITRTYRSCSDDLANSPYYGNATADHCWRLPNAQLVWGGRSTSTWVSNPYVASTVYTAEVVRQMEVRSGDP